MKIAKYLLLLSMLLVLGCGGNSEKKDEKSTNKLNEIVELLNKHCPISAGSIGTLESFEFDGTNIVLNVSINEDYANIDFIKQHEQESREAMLNLFSLKSQDVEPLLKEMLKNNVGLNIVYTGKQTGKKANIIMTPEEFQSMLERPASTPEDLLNQQAAIYNQQLPQDMGDGLVLTNFSVEGEYVVYTCEADENQVSIDYLRENQKELNSAMKLFLIPELDNPAGKILLDLCKETGKDIKYRYIGNPSGKQVEIEISVDEIMSELDNPSGQNNPQKLLELQVAIANKDCPMVIDNGITTTQFYLDGKNIVIECEFDEELYDFDLLKQNRKTMKSVMVESLKIALETGSDPLVTTCKENNNDFVYRYIGKTSGKKMDIVISHNEL